jgi:hypothetical protein
MDTQQTWEQRRASEKKFNFKNEEKLSLNKDVVLHERVLLKS